MDAGKPAGGGGHRRPETTTDLVLKLPAPPSTPVADTPVLITEEQDVFVRCEVAIENLKVAFWAAGKALEIIRGGRLYRADYTSFDDYVDQRWGMSRGQADKLIRMWRVAEALFESTPSDSNDPTRIRVKKLNQAVVWELVPVAEGYDVDVATTVYRTAVEADETAVTADVLRGVVQGIRKALPKSGDAVDRGVLTKAVQTALKTVATKKKAKQGKGTASKKASAPADVPPALPWESPEALNRLLRKHMSVENRRTLGKLLTED
ncbi:hypothetical protein [Streptomyces violaceusniger]